MLIFAVDDEPKMVKLLHKAIEEAAPQEEILDFPLGSAALKAIEEQGLKPDVVFSDIQMPPPTGLEFAVKLKTLVPQAKVVFVTGYDHYAVQSYQIHAAGYMPVRAERIREELEQIVPTLPRETGKLRVRCFGYFDVFWKDDPLIFARSKTKELFAFLIDRRGSVCTAEQVIDALYEGANADNIKKAKQNIRNLVNDKRKQVYRVPRRNHHAHRHPGRRVYAGYTALYLSNGGRGGHNRNAHARFQ